MEREVVKVPHLIGVKATWAGMPGKEESSCPLDLPGL